MNKRRNVNNGQRDKKNCLIGTAAEKLVYYLLPSLLAYSSSFVVFSKQYVGVVGVGWYHSYWMKDLFFQLQRCGALLIYDNHSGRLLICEKIEICCWILR